VGATETELRQQADWQRARMGETLDAIGDRLSPERMVERRKAAIGQRWQRVRTSIMGSPGYQEPVARRMQGRAQEMAESAREGMHQTQQAAGDTVRGNPLAAGFVAFGVGVLVASVLPKSRAEQQLVDTARPQIDRAKQEVRDTARELASDAQDEAREAAQQLKGAATEAGQHVKEEAKGSAQQVKQQATGR